MGVACSVEEGRINLYTKSVSASRVGESLATAACEMISWRWIRVSIEIFARVPLGGLALAIGGFGIGTGEFVMMGLLPDVASHFSVSTPAAGHVISAYALGVILGAPLICSGGQHRAY
jgi:hypothetical protein